MLIFNSVSLCFLHPLYRLNSHVHWFADYAYALPSTICMHIFRGSLVYVMWESSIVINSTPSTKDHKIWPSLVLLMSSFSVFDSKGGRIIGPKASPTHNNTKIYKNQIFWMNFQLVSSQVVLVMGRSMGENPIWERSKKGRKVDYRVRGSISP
jgi:hypothetical protein